MLQSLPTVSESFVEREDDNAAIESHLSTADVRVVELVGGPGFGKSQLALFAARQLLATSDVVFVDLKEQRTAAMVATRAALRLLASGCCSVGARTTTPSPCLRSRPPRFHLPLPKLSLANMRPVCDDVDLGGADN